MSNLLARHQTKIFGVAAFAGAALFLPDSVIQKVNPFHTEAVKNIENRYSSAGGAKTHTPATASHRVDPHQEIPTTHDQAHADVAAHERQRQQDNATGSEEGGKGERVKPPRGIGTTHYEERVADQRTDNGKLGKAWYNSWVGNSKR